MIDALLKERQDGETIAVSNNSEEQKVLLRSLMNVRLPAPVSDEFLQVQDDYLKEALKEKGVTALSDLSPVEENIYLWRGDITLLACDAIVNAANSGMTGCYQPMHTCIDNCIHTFSGMQLRLLCAQMMEKQGFPEPTGQAKLTPAFNLPCKYVLHTVGPIVSGTLTQAHERLLASCYRSCLELAAQNDIHSVAFCCISTGVFGFPQGRAAQIAVETVRDWLIGTDYEMKVIFNVFKQEDECIYRALLG